MSKRLGGSAAQHDVLINGQHVRLIQRFGHEVQLQPSMDPGGDSGNAACAVRRVGRNVYVNNAEAKTLAAEASAPDLDPDGHLNLADPLVGDDDLRYLAGQYCDRGQRADRRGAFGQDHEAVTPRRPPTREGDLRRTKHG